VFEGSCRGIAHMFLGDSLIKNLVKGIHEASPILWVIHRKLSCVAYLNTAGTGVSCCPPWSHSAPFFITSVATSWRHRQVIAWAVHNLSQQAWCSRCQHSCALLSVQLVVVLLVVRANGTVKVSARELLKVGSCSSWWHIQHHAFDS
jgi:hypothetical protein